MISDLRPFTEGVNCWLCLLPLILVLNLLVFGWFLKLYLLLQRTVLKEDMRKQVEAQLPSKDDVFYPIRENEMQDRVFIVRNVRSSGTTSTSPARVPPPHPLPPAPPHCWCSCTIAPDFFSTSPGVRRLVFTCTLLPQVFVGSLSVFTCTLLLLLVIQSATRGTRGAPMVPSATTPIACSFVVRGATLAVIASLVLENYAITAFMSGV